MGVKGDNVPFAGVHEGTESPKKVAKEAKRTFAAGLDLLTLKQQKWRRSAARVPAVGFSALGLVSPDQP